MIEDALVGCSLVNLMYINVWGELLAANSADAFYLDLRPLHYVAATLTVLTGGVLAGLLGQLLRRSPRPIQFPLRIAFLASLLIILNVVRKAAATGVVEQVHDVMLLLRGLGIVGMAAIALVISAVVIRFAAPLSRAYRVVLLVFFPFVIYTLARGWWTVATVDFEQFSNVPHAARAGIATPGRVVIVILDELDYESLYLRRPADLVLPNFDALRLSAVSFDSVVTPGAHTLESMSSFFLGRRVERLEATGARSFVAHMTDGDTVRSDSAKYVLAQPGVVDARKGIIGFGLPYCRLGFAAVAEECDWMPGQAVVWPSGDGSGFWSVVQRQAQSLHPYDARRTHIRRLQLMLDKSVRFASDSSLSLALLHISLPHAPFIWDRNTNEIRDDVTDPDGYFGNLVLTDRFLGRMKEEMVRSGTWAASTVVVMSDHALREKQGVDKRVPLFVKLPRMEAGARISNPVSSLFIVSVLPDLLAGRVGDAPALSSRALDYTQLHPSLLQPPKE